MLFTFPYLPIACSAVGTPNQQNSSDHQTGKDTTPRSTEEQDRQAHLPERVVVGEAGEVPDEHRAVGVADGLGVPERIIWKE
jgi:hypothetical protein